MNKFAIIALYALIVTFSIQYFFPAEKNVNTGESNILLTVNDDDIVIPNIPIIDVVNKTGSGFDISPCKDIKITIDSQPLTDIDKVSLNFCNQARISELATYTVPLSDLAKVFASRAGKYTLSLTTPLGERIVTFTMSEPSSIRAFLTTVVYKPIYNLFVGLLTFLPGHSLGWAIVVITIIVRIILLVPQHHMLESQKKLQVIQPKIKELQKKHKDDQSKLGMEMLELYKKEKVNPMGSCLPLLIQMPMLI
jgi:60Kd inner membrane protein